MLSRRKRILLVEDDGFYKELFNRLIEQLDQDAKLVWVSNANKAIRALKKDTYDLIIADYRLEGAETGMDLWHYCQRELKEVPFLLISAKSRVMSPSPTFLKKPLQLKQCVELITSALSQGSL